MGGKRSADQIKARSKMDQRTIRYQKKRGHIGSALRRRRVELGLTQQQVSTLAGCRVGCLQRHELQKSEAIDLLLVQAFAEALHTTAEQLWEDAARSTEPLKIMKGRPKKPLYKKNTI